jgi:hypothetical protein
MKKNKISEINIEKVFYPNAGKIIKDKKGTLISTIVDEELDEFECRFVFSESVEIQTKGFTRITLGIRQLEHMINLIRMTEAMYERDSKKDKE